jgi:hypothetical protein
VELSLYTNTVVKILRNAAGLGITHPDVEAPLTMIVEARLSDD